MRILIAFIVLAFVSLPVVAESPFFQANDLFTSGDAGVQIYRIPGLVVTAKGTLLAYCEARYYGSDWGRIDIMLRRSDNGGKTWSPARIISQVPDGARINPVARSHVSSDDEITVNNPVAIADRNGAVHFLYCIEYERCFYMRSDDDGLTFTDPVEMTSTFENYRPGYNWKVIATGPNHGIQLKNGRLIVPVWLSLGTGGNAHRPSCVSTIYSDDGGQTWQRGEIIANNSPEQGNPSETLALELADGRVMVNIRNESPTRRRLVAYSPDGAAGWTAPAYDDALYEPTCMAGLTRYSLKPNDDKNIILFSNPDNQFSHSPAENPRARQNLVIKLSEDEGKTWPHAKVLDGGIVAYSDLLVGPDQTIYCLYERGDNQFKQNYRYITLARFNLEWLMK